MKTRFCYGFEELTDDLPRPPKAALRAMFAAGILVSPRGWNQLANETRQALALEGTREKVNSAMVGELLKEAPPGQIRLVSKTVDPPSDAVPAPLAKALGPMRTIAPAEWASLRALDRYVLASLSANTRLLWKALEEMASAPGSKLSRKVLEPWSGVLARCELKLSPAAVEKLMSRQYLDGRAFVLARTAGVRAARKVSDTFDLQADTVPGPAELDYGFIKKTGTFLWQGHVSTWDGEFFPAASLLAVSAAAIALFDMAKEVDPLGSITAASVAEEPWQVGQADREESTALYSARSNPELFQHRTDRKSSEPAPEHSAPPAPPPEPAPLSSISGAALVRDSSPSSSQRPSGERQSAAPVSNRSPEPAAPAPIVKFPAAAMRDSVPSEPPARDLPMSQKKFLVLLLVSMIVVAFVSTVVAVFVVRALGN